MDDEMTFKNRLRRLLVPFRHIGVVDTDLLLVSYPRSGSTWLRFMLFESLTGRSADFDEINRAIPYVGRHRGAAPLLPGNGRLIQTHELFRAGNARIIYLVRDMRAVLPSMYRQQMRAAGSLKDFGVFVREFVAGTVSPFGSWVDHVNLWVDSNLSTEEGIILVRFEDLRADPAEKLREILTFAGIAVGGSRLASAVRNNDLNAMKRREREAGPRAILNRREDLPFVGSGSVESWRELDPGHLALIETAAGDALQRLGYQLTQSRGTP